MEQFLCWIIRDGWQISMANEPSGGRDMFAIRITKGETTFGRRCVNEPEDVRMLIHKMESFAAMHCNK